ncbi:MAG: aldo/keto reductase [Thermoplasmata archaeon]|nr:aldo/keto reductase [Thermoplasmata archaeon]
MEYLKLGNSDLKVSRIGLGAMQFGPMWIKEKEVMMDILNHALDNGVNFIDTAEVYGKYMSETVIGEGLKERGDRDDLIIATKVHPFNLRYDDVIKAAEGSLKRLQTDVIDLYQVHHHNAYVPASGTMRALDQLLKEGKVRYVGVSNYSVSLMKEAMSLLKNGEIISNQMEYSLLMRDVETEILPFQRENGIATIAYSPLAMGMLSGKYDEKTELDEKDYRRNDPLFMNKENLGEAQKLISVMREVGASHEATPAEVALNWLLKSDDVFPIFGSKNIEQAQSNINASKWTLSEEEWKKITAASDNLNLDFSIDFSKL